MAAIKKFFAMLFLLAFVVVSALGAFSLMLPAEWTIRRSIEIGASPSRVYPLFADLRNWKIWSPWEKADPMMKTSIPGRVAGVGAKQTWTSGDGKTSGETEIVSATRNAEIQTRITMTGEFETDFTCRMMLDRIQGEGSDMLWACTGREKNPLQKLMAHLMFERMMGPDFEAGLAGIKKAAETGAPYATMAPEAPAAAPQQSAVSSQPSATAATAKPKAAVEPAPQATPAPATSPAPEAAPTAPAPAPEAATQPAPEAAPAAAEPAAAPATPETPAVAP